MRQKNIRIEYVNIILSGALKWRFLQNAIQIYISGEFIGLKFFNKLTRLWSYVHSVFAPFTILYLLHWLVLAARLL